MSRSAAMTTMVQNLTNGSLPQETRSTTRHNNRFDNGMNFIVDNECVPSASAHELL